MFRFTNHILLGFYVSLVVKRWWEQYCKLPWPDSITIYLKCLVVGDYALMIRRTIIRYYILSYILCIRRLSVRLRKKFPTMQEIIQTGVVRPDEAVRIGEKNSPQMYGSNWWTGYLSNGLQKSLQRPNRMG